MSDLEKQEILSGPPQDKHHQQITIYEAGYSEIFWKNFLAGFGRSLGGIIVYAVFVIVIGGIAVKTLLPIFAPLLEQLGSVTSTLDKMPKF